MPSRLADFATRVTELAPFLSTENIKTFTDLLAVVTAANEMDLSIELDDARLSYVVAQINRVEMVALREALAKLNEVQP